MPNLSYQGQARNSRPTPLTRIGDRARELLEPAARAIVEDGSDYMLARVKEHTPESHPPAVLGYPYAPGGDGIHMRDEIHRTEVSFENDTAEAEVGSNKDYGPYLEEGTGLYGPKHAKYLIVPHNPDGYLAWPGDDGKMHFAKSVWHPGSPGVHMFLTGGIETENAIPLIRTRGDQIIEEGMR